MRSILFALIITVPALGQGTTTGGRTSAKTTVSNTAAPSTTRLTSEQENAAVAGATIFGVGIVMFVIIVTVSFLFQLLPVLIAFVRGHPNKWAITALSILLGWTCIGWIIAFIWSLTGQAEQVHYHYGRGR